MYLVVGQGASCAYFEKEIDCPQSKNDSLVKKPEF